MLTMKLEGRGGVMADRSMGSSSAGGREMLPMVFCPTCKLKVIGDIADNDRNRGRAYMDDNGV